MTQPILNSGPPGQMVPEGAFRPCELVDYQSGSIVSRTLHKSAAGTITLFAFDGGQDLSEHTTPCEAYVQILEGKAELTIAGKSVAVAEGEIARFPAGEPHAVRAPERFKMLLVMMRS
jgi:quercetin dioxygenase-like cupin family protein